MAKDVVIVEAEAGGWVNDKVGYLEPIRKRLLLAYVYFDVARTGKVLNQRWIKQLPWEWPSYMHL